MAIARQIPPERPRVMLELDADEAELVLALLDKTQAEDGAIDERRKRIAMALRMASVQPIETPVRLRESIPKPPVERTESPVERL